MKSKQLRTGLTQLGEEGAIQVFRPHLGGSLLLGAIGQLQFEVVAPTSPSWVRPVRSCLLFIGSASSTIWKSSGAKKGSPVLRRLDRPGMVARQQELAHLAATGPRQRDQPAWVESLLPQLKASGRLYLMEDDAQRLYDRARFDLAVGEFLMCLDHL